jgi:hypothetical protein
MLLTVSVPTRPVLAVRALVTTAAVLRQVLDGSKVLLDYAAAWCRRQRGHKNGESCRRDR